MVKSHKDKVVHKAMKSIDKFYNEVPGEYKTKKTKLYFSYYDIFSVRWYFRWGDLVPVLLHVCLLHDSLCFSIIQVNRDYYLSGILLIYSRVRYVELRSQDPLDKDHAGVKLKRKGAQNVPPSQQRTEFFYKEE